MEACNGILYDRALPTFQSSMVALFSA